MPNRSNSQSQQKEKESSSSQVPVSRLKRSGPEHCQDRQRKRSPGREKKPLAAIEYDPKLLENALLWGENPLSIFADDAGPWFHCNPVEELVTRMVKIQDGGSLNTIRSRLLSVIFHKLKDEGLDVQRLRSANAAKLADIARRSGISENGTSREHPVTEKQIRDWTNLGTKIHELCEAVGGYGTIFFLGAVSDYQFVSHRSLPPSIADPVSDSRVAQGRYLMATGVYTFSKSVMVSTNQLRGSLTKWLKGLSTNHGERSNPPCLEKPLPARR